VFSLGNLSYSREDAGAKDAMLREVMGSKVKGLDEDFLAWAPFPGFEEVEVNVIV
jgi:hypothetical protein